MASPVVAVAMGLDFGGGSSDSGASSAVESRIVDRIGRFGSPSRLALSKDALYVSDTTRGVVAVFDLEGVRVGTLKGAARPLGVAAREIPGAAAPECVLAGRSGRCKRGKKWSSPPPPQLVTRVWVGDERDGSVRVFEGGEPVAWLGQGSGEFARPNAIALSSDAVYVVDSDADRVAVYDLGGRYLTEFGSAGSGPGQLDFPSDVVLNEAAGEVYVADFGNQRIAVFDLAGVWLRDILAPPNDSGDPIFMRPSGLGIDADGNLYVVDAALSCVVVMDATGTLLDAAGYQNGAYWTGEFEIPIDAVTDGTRVWVTSSKQHRVNVFEVSR